MAQVSEGENPGAKIDLKDGTWFMVYPIYLDSNRTVAQGRKVSKEHACIAPIPKEIAEACQFYNLPCVYERLKAHPRSPIDRMGRIRVKLRSSKDGPPTNPEIPTKKELLRKIGAKIPSLASRKERKIVTQEEIEIPDGAKDDVAPTKKDKKKKKKGKR